VKDGFVFDDGGRALSGRKGFAGDCVCRAIAIAAELPYDDVYKRLAKERGEQRVTSRTGKKRASAREGINTRRKWFKDYMSELGFEWVPCMSIGSGCKVHLTADELPRGRLIVAVSKHYTAMIDGVIHDTHDPRREVHCIENYHGQELKPGQWLHPLRDRICWIERRCVYGYWRLSA
jgi:hypothetical protein